MIFQEDLGYYLKIALKAFREVWDILRYFFNIEEKFKNVTETYITLVLQFPF